MSELVRIMQHRDANPVSVGLWVDFRLQLFSYHVLRDAAQRCYSRYQIIIRHRLDLDTIREMWLDYES